MWTVSLPLTVPVSKNKRFSLNLNVYRNEHHQTLNKAKVEFARIAKALIKVLPKGMTQINIDYVLFPKTRRDVDVANVCCIVDKFFSDSLTACGVISDDNHQFVPRVSYAFGAVDPHDPRCEATITLTEGATMYIEPEQSDEESMKITINQAEIESAITAYIMSQVSIKEGQKIAIDLKATRGAEGYSAEIEITAEQTSSTANISVASAIAAAREEPVAVNTSTVQAAVAATEAATPAPAAQDTAPAAPTDPVVQPAPAPTETAPAASVTAQPAEAVQERPSLFGNLNTGA